MNRRMTICQRLTGDVRTESERKNIRGQGVVFQNNILNINLMYSRSLAHLFSKTVWLSLKCQPSRRIEISLHCHKEDYMQLCSYAVFFLRGMKRDEKKFYYIYYNIYNNYIFSRKATKIVNRVKNNCITA